MRFLKQHYFWIKTFLGVWAGLALTFSFCMATFFLGNHDYLFLRYGMSLNSGVWEGRLTQFLFPWLLSGNQILPVINMLMAFVFYSAAALFLAKWYGLKEHKRGSVLFALMIVLNPYIVSQIYYTYTILSIGCWHFFAILGVYLIYEGIKTGRLIYTGGGICCLFLCLGGYAPSLQLIMTVLTGRFLIDIINADMRPKLLFKLYFKIFAVILFSCCCLFALIHELKQARVVLDMYNVKILSVVEMLKRVSFRFADPWKLFFTPLPYCPAGCSLLLGGLFVLSFTAMKTWCERIWFILAVLALGYAMSTVFWLSAEDILRYYRVNSFSYPYAAGLFFAITELRGSLCARNLSRVIVVFLLFYFVRADIMVQKVWHLGNQQDIRIVERIKKDVLPELDPKRFYRLAVIGNLYGQAKFAQRKMIPGYMDYVREYGYYPLYLPIFFSHGFFSTEAINPISGDANYFSAGMIYINNNEHFSAEEREGMQWELYIYPPDIYEVYNAIETMTAYPHGKYYFVGTKDIVIRLSEGLVARSLLHRYLYSAHYENVNQLFTTLLYIYLNEIVLSAEDLE